MYIKVTGDLPTTISFLEKTRLDTFPGRPFRHGFMSEELGGFIKMK
jgi:hypothetical protein